MVLRSIPTSAKLALESILTLHRRRISLSGSLLLSDPVLFNQQQSFVDNTLDSQGDHSFPFSPNANNNTSKAHAVKSLILGQDPRKLLQDVTFNTPYSSTDHSALSTSSVHGISCRPTSSFSSVAAPTNHRNETSENNKKKKSKLVVVLDMDECLVHSQFPFSSEDQYRQYEQRPDTKTNCTDLCDSFHFCMPNKNGVIHVYKRPHLDVFLQKVTQRFETYIFTAAVEEYAKPLLDILDPHGNMFMKRFYRNSCTFDPQLGVYIKNLYNILPAMEPQCETRCKFPRSERNMVLVDNNPFSFLANPSNGILVSNFYDDPSDSTLEAVYELLLELEHSEDVRPILDAKFGLKDALQLMLGHEPENLS